MGRARGGARRGGGRAGHAERGRGARVGTRPRGRVVRGERADPILNRMARESAANMRVLLYNPADPDDLDDPPSLARVRAVVRAAVRVAEHAIGVVVPEARAHYTAMHF